MSPQYPPNPEVPDCQDEPLLEYAVKGTTAKCAALQQRLEEAEGLLLLSHGRLRIHQEKDLADNIQAFLTPTPPTEPKKELYPCDTCGTMRTKAEGGTTFTVCDECWDKEHPKTAEPLEPTNP